MTALLGLPEGSEWIILLVVALLLFGGSRIAAMGKGAGRAIREFREEMTGTATVEAPTAVEPAGIPAPADLSTPADGSVPAESAPQVEISRPAAQIVAETSTQS